MKAADKVIAKGKKIAGHLLEASDQDITFENGMFIVAGTDRQKSFSDIALAAYVPHNYPLEVLEPGFEEQAYYDPINFTYPGGAHIAEVEIDPDSCAVTLVNYVAVDDIGTVINPMIAEGQLHGGIVQGIGQALYDASGQLLSGSFMIIACRGLTTSPPCRLRPTARSARTRPWASKVAVRWEPSGPQRR